MATRTRLSWLCCFGVPRPTSNSPKRQAQLRSSARRKRPDGNVAHKGELNGAVPTESPPMTQESASSGQALQPRPEVASPGSAAQAAAAVQAEAAAPPTSSGASSQDRVKVIGNYVLSGRTLGKGNFARVEEALHTATKAKVRASSTPGSSGTGLCARKDHEASQPHA